MHELLALEWVRERATGWLITVASVTFWTIRVRSLELHFAQKLGKVCLLKTLYFKEVSSVKLVVGRVHSLCFFRHDRQFFFGCLVVLQLERLILEHWFRFVMVFVQFFRLRFKRLSAVESAFLLRSPCSQRRCLAGLLLFIDLLQTAPWLGGVRATRAVTPWLDIHALKELSNLRLLRQVWSNHIAPWRPWSWVLLTGWRIIVVFHSLREPVAPTYRAVLWDHRNAPYIWLVQLYPTLWSSQRVSRALLQAERPTYNWAFFLSWV